MAEQDLGKLHYPSITRMKASSLFSGMDQRSEVFEAIIDPKQPDKLTPQIEHLILNGAQELITMFNNLEPINPLLHLPSLQRTLELKQNVGSLPNLMDLTDKREIAFALVNGSNRILDGQSNKRDAAQGKVISPKRASVAIGTPSLDIPLETKAIAVGLHLIERAMFVHFRNQDEELRFHKDDILFALEDMAQLAHAKKSVGVVGASDAILFDLINKPSSEGGLGWRNPSNLERVCTEFTNFLSAQTVHEEVL